VALTQDKPLYTVEQSFDSGKSWSKRGSVQTVGINKRLNYVPDSPGVWEIPAEAQSSKTSLYQIRFVDQENNAVLSSISLCDLIRSQFREVMLLHVDQSSHKLIAVDYSTATDATQTSSPFSRAASSCPLPDSAKRGTTKQNVRIGVANPIVGDKISFTGVKSVEEKKKEEEVANEPGFLRKYVSGSFFTNIVVVFDYSWCLNGTCKLVHCSTGRRCCTINRFVETKHLNE
jgi:hypothetical protein